MWCTWVLSVDVGCQGVRGLLQLSQLVCSLPTCSMALTDPISIQKSPAIPVAGNLPAAQSLPCTHSMPCESDCRPACQTGSCLRRCLRPRPCSGCMILPVPRRCKSSDSAWECRRCCVPGRRPRQGLKNMRSWSATLSGWKQQWIESRPCCVTSWKQITAARRLPQFGVCGAETPWWTTLLRRCHASLFPLSDSIRPSMHQTACLAAWRHSDQVTST